MVLMYMSLTRLVGDQWLPSMLSYSCDEIFVMLIGNLENYVQNMGIVVSPFSLGFLS